MDLPVRKVAAPALALVHLVAIRLAANGAPSGRWSLPWAFSALAVTAYLLTRDYLLPRRKDRLPDVRASLAWGAAFALELHAIAPAVAASRIVPAVLFPGMFYLLPPLPAAAYAGTAAAWLMWLHVRAGTGGGAAVGLGAMAVLGALAGWAARRKVLRAGAGGDSIRRTIEEGRSLVLSWDAASGTERERERVRAAGEIERGHLRRGDDFREGIRRIVEGLLPVCGADRIDYVSTRTVRGRSFRIGPSACRSENVPEEGLLIPDSYVPVREALVFRRPFFADGREARAWGIDGAGKGLTPTGIAAVPVIAEGKAEGVLLALRYGDGRWSDPVVPSLEMGAFLAGREILLARRLFENDRSLLKREGLHRLVRKIAEAAEAEGGAEAPERVSPRREVYRAAMEQVRQELDADRALLVETEGKGGRGRLACAAGGREKESDGEDVPLGDTYVEWVMRTEMHRIFSGITQAPAKHPILPAPWADPEEDGFLLVPVTGAGGFRGVLVCASRGERVFDSRDLEVALDVLRVMRMGISHAYRIESLAREATTDGLTALLNHRTFKTRLESNLARLDGRHPCAVVLLDIDHFKRVNDTYGHPAGDEVLRKVAGVIRKTVRKGDFAGRYGGEEFVIFFHMTDAVQARQAAERLRLMIRQAKFLLDGKEVVVTASLGIACSPAHGVSGEELLSRADEALYRSKQEGRDRTTLWGGD